MSVPASDTRSVWSRRIHEPFIAGALFIGLTTGFGYGALLAAGPALKIPLDRWWGPTIQAHGHAQLLGWMGLFILGVGLFFLPRLRGTQLRASERAPLALALLVLGILLRTVAQPALGFAAPGSFVEQLLSAAWVLSAVAELMGLGVVASMLLATERAQPPLAEGAPAYPVIRLIRIAFVSFGLALVANLFGTVIACLGGQSTIPSAWDSLTIQLLLYGLAIPMAMVFAVRNLPLYLRLAPPPRDEWRSLAAVYALALVLRLIPTLASAVGIDLPVLSLLGAVGTVGQSLIILTLVWLLDLLRRRPPWTVDRISPTAAPNARPVAQRRTTRPNYPDYGEFGRFELLIYAAFAWLAAAALMELVRGAALVLGLNSPVPIDAARHTLTVGFITLLIFGMAVRMVPGFSSKRRIAYPALVMAMFILGNLATLLRVVPLFFPASSLATSLFGLSGAVGWVAVAVLAVNLAQKVRLEK